MRTQIAPRIAKENGRIRLLCTRTCPALDYKLGDGTLLRCSRSGRYVGEGGTCHEIPVAAMDHLVRSFNDMFRAFTEAFESVGDCFAEWVDVVIQLDLDLDDEEETDEESEV